MLVDGGWGFWSPWSACSALCGQGFTVRTRSCDSPAPAFGGKDCIGKKDESQQCHVDPCWRRFLSLLNLIFNLHSLLCHVNKYLLLSLAAQPQWGPWTSWSSCSKTCKGGLQGRVRLCDSPAPAPGQQIGCEGPDEQNRICNADIVCDGK